jgi:hypothetical protein
MDREKMKTVQWIRPRIVAEIVFNERTHAGHFVTQSFFAYVSLLTYASSRQIPIAVDMAMLSKLWYFRLLDDRGRRHALADIAVALLKSDYPVVTDLLYRNSDGEQMMLPWQRG